jgi:hypothetical protein
MIRTPPVSSLFYTKNYVSVPGINNMLSRRNLCRGIFEVKRELTRTKRNSSIPNTIKSINLSYTFSLNRWSPRHAKTKRSQGIHWCTQMQIPPRSSTTVSSWTGLVYVTGDPSERSPTWHTVEKHKLVGNGTNVRKIDGQREPSDKAKRYASAVKSTESRKHVSFKRNTTGEDNTSLIQL